MKRTLLALGAILLTCCAALAQTDRGTIEGIVTDPTGAAVPDARVRVVRTETNDATAFATNSVGRYFAANLPMGTYRIEVEKAGFRSAHSQPILLQSQNSARADIRLEVGGTAETVSVTTQAPMLDASNATLTAGLTTNYVNELPMINVGRRRQIFGYLKYLPGVDNASGNPRVNGSKAGSNEVFVDGAPTAAQPNQQGGYSDNAVSIEHVGEFNLVTNAFSAEYGRTGTWFANLTVRSGTNEFHGSMFDYFSNDKLNARGFFPATRPVLRQNEAGFALGAPVYIPKIYNGRNRTFFFFGQQFFYNRGAGAGNPLTIPTTDFRSGDFSGLRDAAGTTIPIFDPATQRSDGKGGFVRDQFPGNRIPAARFSPIAKNLFALMPDPDIPGAQTQNYYNRTGADPKYDSYVSTAKIDHGFSDRQKLSVTYSQHHNPWIISGRGWGLASPLEGLQDPKRVDTRTGRVNYDFIIRPTILSHTTVGVDRYENATSSQGVGEGWDAKLGLKGLPYPTGAIPYITFGGGTASPLTISNRDYSMRGFGRYSFNENLTWIHGRHSMKFGGNYIREYNNLFEGKDGHGSFSFSNAQTSQPNAGTNYSRWGSSTASFLLGAVSQGSTRSPFTAGYRWNFFSWFAQDEWRATTKLTVSYGLRWEFSPAGFEKYDRTSTFSPMTPNPAVGGIPGAIVFAGNCSGCIGGRNTVNDWKRGFAPRLGLAYQLDPKTVVRASGGIYYAVSRFNPGSDGYTVTPSFNSIDGYTPAFRWDDGFPQDFKRPPLVDPGLLNGQNVTYLSPGITRLPQTLTWTLSVQRQLAQSLALEVTYVGSHSTHLHDGDPGDNINDKLGFTNVVDSSYLALGNTLLQPITSAAAVAAGIKAPYPGFATSRTNTVAQALRPFPQYLNIAGGDPAGIARYNSLQTKVTKRYAGGLTMLAFYTWAKNMTNAEAGTYQTLLDRKSEVSVSADGSPHTFATSVAYELPFGPGKRYLSHGVLGHIAGGWELSGYARVNSGAALAITSSNNLGALGYAGKRASYVAGQPVHLDSNPRDFDPATSRYLNVDAFSIPAAYELGNTARVLDWARGWTSRSESMSLRKRIPIGERARLVTRADADNPFNFVRWSNPNTTRGDANFGKVTNASAGRRIQLNMSLEW